MRDGNGQQLAYVYFEGESGGGKIIGAGRGEMDCRKYRETAGAIESPSDVEDAMSAVERQQHRQVSLPRMGHEQVVIVVRNM